MSIFCQTPLSWASIVLRQNERQEEELTLRVKLYGTNHMLESLSCALNAFILIVGDVIVKQS
jgi:hypothetical protein